MTSRLAPIRVSRCHSISAASNANGSSTTSIATKWPMASGQSAANSARGRRSINPADTASGQPIPGFAP